jgi:hypothetical protein
MKVVLDGMLLKGPFSGVEVSICELARALSMYGEATYTFCVPVACPEPDITGARFRTVRYGRHADRRLLRILWEQGTLPAVAAREQAAVLHAPGYVAPLRARMPVVISGLLSSCETQTTSARAQIGGPPSSRLMSSRQTSEICMSAELVKRMPPLARLTG